MSRNNKKDKYYIKKFQDPVFEKLESPLNNTVKNLSQELEISSLGDNLYISEDFQNLKEALKEEQQKTKRLQRELRRKNKALAEAVTLLILREK